MATARHSCPGGHHQKDHTPPFASEGAWRPAGPGRGPASLQGRGSPAPGPARRACPARSRSAGSARHGAVAENDRSETLLFLSHCPRPTEDLMDQPLTSSQRSCTFFYYFWSRFSGSVTNTQRGLGPTTPRSRVARLHGRSQPGAPQHLRFEPALQGIRTHAPPKITNPTAAASRPPSPGSLEERLGRPSPGPEGALRPQVRGKSRPHWSLSGLRGSRDSGGGGSEGN